MIKSFTQFDLIAPSCHPGVQIFSAHFKLEVDISELFPYINAEVEDAVYYENPHYIKCTIEGHVCALYPDIIRARPFENRDQAIDYFEKLKTFLNDLNARKDSIEPDYSTYKYILVMDVLKKLPQTNCEKCGFMTCMAFAAAVSRGEVDYECCPEYKQ